MRFFRFIVCCLLLSIIALPFTTVTKAADVLPSQADIITQMRLVNDYWISGHSNLGDCDWENASYSTGNMAMYYTTNDSKYLNYSLNWANNNNWATYNYNSSNPTTNADDQCCGQTYMELYQINPISSRIAVIKESLDIMVNQSQVNDWYWIDAIFMSAPDFARMGYIQNNTSYYNKMYQLYNDTGWNRKLYDSAEGLWYRDANWIYPTQKTGSGNKVFWGRGNGWVMAAMARVLQYLPANDAHRSNYITMLQSMANTLKNIQGSDGFWRSSLYDVNDYPNPETTGTAFFTFALAWGINNGYLDRSTYYPVVAKAWNGMNSTAVHTNGFLGYCQATGSSPASTTYDTTMVFGVGGFLLAGSEVAKLASTTPTPTPTSGTTPTPTPIVTSTPTPTPTPIATGVNLALNKPITCSSEQTGNEATHLVDGDAVNTRWAASPMPQWAQIDLGAVYSVNKTDMVPYSSRAYQYTVQVSTDGTNFTQVVDQTANTTGSSLFTDTFTAVNARYVKLTVTGCYNYTGTWASINEFRVYSATVSTPTPTPKPINTPTPTPRPSITPTPTPSVTPRPTVTPVATPTPTPTSGANLALNKPVTCSSQTTGYEASKAVDGDLNTRWWSSANSNQTQWLRVDLGALNSISRIELAPYSNMQYMIEVSTDDIKYTTVVDWTRTRQQTLVSSTFTAVNARYVRLSLTGNYGSSRVSAWEFRVFNK